MHSSVNYKNHKSHHVSSISAIYKNNYMLGFSFNSSPICIFQHLITIHTPRTHSADSDKRLRLYQSIDQKAWAVVIVRNLRINVPYKYKCQDVGQMINHFKFMPVKMYKR